MWARVGLGVRLVCHAELKHPARRKQSRLELYSGLPTAATPNRRSDRVREVDELPLEVELLGQTLREGLDTDPFGRVVARRDEVDP
jgi:hypothetical protein